MESIRKLSLADVDKVTTFYFEEYVPDEPWFSSLGIFNGNSLWTKKVKSEWKKTDIIEPIESGHSFGAFDADGNLLGIQLGKILTKETAEKLPSVGWIFRMPECLVPKQMLMKAYAIKAYETFQYSEDLAFEHCKDNNNKIYDNGTLAVAKRARGLGLGDKLLKHSIIHAKECGCSHAFASTSGIFSQKIFRNNGYDIVYEGKYEDFKDKHGQQIIYHPLHKTSQINVLKLI